MAPGLLSDLPTHSGSADDSRDWSPPSEPLKVSGAIDRFEHEDVTPVIGREYPHVNIVNDLFNADNADELIRDLAINSRLG